MGVKQQDIRTHLNGVVDQKVITMLCAIVEEHRALKQQLMEMAQQQDKMVDILMNVTNIADNMKKTTDRMNSIDGQGNVNVMSLDEGDD